MKHKKTLKKFVFLLLIFNIFSISVLANDENKSEDEKKLSVTAKKRFASNELLQFSIDTKEEEGYVYLLYIDNKGLTNVLYPKEASSLEKKSGKLNFPKDFDNVNIRTSKECKNCKEEKTTIFVLLSNDPIEDIENMGEEEIVNLNSKSRTIVFGEIHKGILMRQIDFFVE